MRRQRASGRRRSAPSPVHGRVDEHPVERAVPPGGAGAVGGDHAEQPGPGGGGAPWRPAGRGAPAARRPAAGRRAPPASAASSADLPPGPAHTSSQRSSRPSSAAVGEADRDQLGALVLHAGATLGDGGHGGRVAPVEPHGVGRQPGRRTPGGHQLVDRGQPGAGHEGDLRARRCRRPAASSSSASPSASPSASTTQRGWACAHRGEADRVGRRVRRHPAHPAGQVVGGDLAEHGVDEAGRALPDRGPDQVDAGADRGVRRHPHRQQLVGAEPQRVEHAGVDLGQRPVDVGRDAPRRRCPAAGSSRTTSSVANAASRPVSPRARRHRGQHEVGVGVLLAHGRQARRTPPARAGSTLLPRGRRRFFARRAAHAEPRAGLQPRHRAPSRRPASASCRSGLTSPSSTGPEPVPTWTAFLVTSSTPGRERVAVGSSRTGPSLTRSPSNVVQAPGAGVQARTCRSTRDRGPVQSTSASSTLDLGRQADPVGRLLAGLQRRRPRCRPGCAPAGRRRRVASRLQQVAGGVVGPDPLGHHAVGRPGVERLDDPERRGAGDLVAGPAARAAPARRRARRAAPRSAG